VQIPESCFLLEKTSSTALFTDHLFRAGSLASGLAPEQQPVTAGGLSPSLSQYRAAREQPPCYSKSNLTVPLLEAYLQGQNSREEWLHSNACLEGNDATHYTCI
jgi:hypothetical protein